MPARYDKKGIRFSYPENWTLDESDTAESQRAVSVTSPDGSFWSVVLHDPSVDPDELAVTALEAIRQEYAESEVEPASETIAGQHLAGYDLSFYYVDLVNTAIIRGFRGADSNGLILYQAEDRDFRRLEKVFEAITTSLLSEVAPADDDDE